MRKKTEPFVYCGPTIPHVARSFTTYKEVPTALAEKAVQCPEIFSLLVPLSKMAGTRRALKMTGSKEAILYGRIEKFLKGGN